MIPHGHKDAIAISYRIKVAGVPEFLDVHVTPSGEVRMVPSYHPTATKMPLP